MIVGSRYRSVRNRIIKRGLADIDALVYDRPVTRATARLYVCAIMGPMFPLSFRRGMRSAGRGWSKGITLNLDLVGCNRLMLGTVIHECAHAIQSIRYRSGSRHDEGFTHTYIRLLKAIS